MFRNRSKSHYEKILGFKVVISDEEMEKRFLKKRDEHFDFTWEGGLSDLKDKYTSIELPLKVEHALSAGGYRTNDNSNILKRI